MEMTSEVFKFVDRMKEGFDVYRKALLKAAEEAYQSEMVDTNMETLDIREFAEKYKYYGTAEERATTINQCEFETKEQWIGMKIDEWIKND